MGKLNVKLEGWSRTKVFCLFAVLLGIFINLNLIVLYLTLNLDAILVLGFIAMAFFITYVTGVMVQKTTGTHNKFFVGIFSFIAQFLIAIAVFMPVAFLAAFVSFVTPVSIRGDSRLERDLINRFKTEYEISVISSDVILHSSSWGGIAPGEWGYDLIVSLSDSNPNRLSPYNEQLVPLQEKQPALPFRFSNRQFLCTDESPFLPTSISIENPSVRRIICLQNDYPAGTLIAETRVGESQLTITSVFFPDTNIVWITEIKW